MKIHYPLFGNTLASQMRWGNKPGLVIIGVGGDAMARAKNWQNNTSFAPLVMKYDSLPKQLTWPVKDCVCLIEWDVGPSAEMIKQLIECLEDAGALSIKVMCLFSDYQNPTNFYDKETGQWIETDRAKREITSMEHHQTNRSTTCPAYA